MKVVLLFMLYIAQGLPFGFQTTALPLVLRGKGLSLVAIAFTSALALPWFLKPLWAPFVDGYGVSRRAWIVPMQVGLAAACLAAGLIDPTSPAALTPLLGLVFLMNLFAASQDIAVDGLAVDLLGARQLGAGNAAQVVGYKLGILLGGGAFVTLGSVLGWRERFFAMAGVVALALVAVALIPDARGGPRERMKPKSVLADLVRALAASRPLLLFLIVYKVGESMSTTTWKLSLHDAGLGDPFIGLLSIVGLIASIVGSLAGAWLATTMSIERALWFPAIARIAPLLAQVFVALHPTKTLALVVSLAEHFAGGALTPIVFALMMSRVDRRIGASHYTALAAIEVAGKYPAGWVGGWIAQSLGYPTTFAVATAATVLVLLAIPGLRRTLPPPADPAVLR